MNFEMARRKMVDSQIRPDEVTDERVIAAFLAVERERFVPKSRQSVAYAELELKTDTGRQLWLPRDAGKMLQALKPSPTDIALVIGAGEGYFLALLHELVETVIGIEENEETVEATSERLNELGVTSAVVEQAKLEDGLASEAPFDLILANGSVEFVPDAWLEQLADGGRLGVVVTGADNTAAHIYTRSRKHVSSRRAFSCVTPVLEELRLKKSFVF